MPKPGSRRYSLYNEDCFETFERIAPGSLDMVLCDPPYGTTQCKWDSVIPLEPMWTALKLLAKPLAAVVLTSTEPFTSVLICSNLPQYKYRWVWKKTRPGGFVNAKLRPLKDAEDVCVFSDGVIANGSGRKMWYFPQGVQPGKEWSRPRKYRDNVGYRDGVGYVRESHKTSRRLDGEGYPREIIEFSNPNSGLVHPTQKPVALMEYLIKTYTQPGDLVLDFAMGSGTTGVACGNLRRRFIGCDNDLENGYFAIATDRIQRAYGV